MLLCQRYMHSECLVYTWIYQHRLWQVSVCHGVFAVLCIRCPCLIFVCVFFSRLNPASASLSLGRGARGRPDLLVTSSHWSPLWSKWVQHVKLQQSGAAPGASFINRSIKYSPTLPLPSAIPSTSLHYSWLFSWWSKQKESWSHEVQTGITMS